MTNLRDSGTVLRGGRYGRRHMRDARGHHCCLTPKLQDRKDGADCKNSVDQGFESAALLFLRAHEKRIGGFKCFRISRGCFHGYLSVRCCNPAVRIQASDKIYGMRRSHQSDAAEDRFCLDRDEIYNGVLTPQARTAHQPIQASKAQNSPIKMKIAANTGASGIRQAPKRRKTTAIPPRAIRPLLSMFGFIPGRCGLWIVAEK